MHVDEGSGVAPLRDSIGMIFLLLVVSMVGTPLLFSLIGRQIPGFTDHNSYLILAILAQQAVLLALTFWRLRVLGVSWEVLRPFIDSVTHFGAGLWNGVGLLFANAIMAQISALLLIALLGSESVEALIAREQNAVGRLIDPSLGKAQLAAFVFLAVGVAPFVEEVFYRGYAYPILKARVGRHALWMGALLFALVHFYVVNFLSIFVLGILLARLYERTRSLSVPIVAHATVNGLVAAIAIFVESSGLSGM